MKKMFVFSLLTLVYGCASTPAAPPNPPPPSALDIVLNDCRNGKTTYQKYLCITNHPKYPEVTVHMKTAISHNLMWAERLDKGQITNAEFQYEINKFYAERQDKRDAELNQAIRDIQYQQAMTRPRLTNCYNNFGYGMNCTSY